MTRNFLIFGILLLFVSFPGCETSLPSDGAVRLQFVSASGDPLGASFEPEIVATPGARAQGLMYRRKMDDQKGMLFVFPDQKVRSFWMKNTYIPLDMVFIDSGFVVVGVLENVPPHTTSPRTVGHPAQYVLELNAGVARRIGLKAGARMNVSGELPKGQM